MRHDQEVFVDPLPGEPGSPELDEFLSAFGQVSDVYHLPGQERGYVMFVNHNGARACVESGAATWSESERVLNWKTERICTYPVSLSPLINGEKGATVREAGEKSGAAKLRYVYSDGGRARFVCKASPQQADDLRGLLEEILARAHDKVSELCREVVVTAGLPEDLTEEDARLFCAQYGEIESLELTSRTRA